MSPGPNRTGVPRKDSHHFRLEAEAALYIGDATLDQEVAAPPACPSRLIKPWADGPLPPAVPSGPAAGPQTLTVALEAFLQSPDVPAYYFFCLKLKSLNIFLWGILNNQRTNQSFGRKEVMNGKQSFWACA